MRFASLESVRRSGAVALRRFPLPIACAWAAFAIFDGSIVIGLHHPGWLAAGLMLCLGIPSCFALARWSERRGPGRPALERLLPQLGAVLILAVIAWQWPHWSGAIQWRRYVQLSLLAHALVAFLPYLAVREPNGFWQYNRLLLERFVLATIFATVLMAGLMGALGALSPLFGIGVPGEAFSLVANWAFFVFHPWFFLAGIPEDFESLEARRDYPATVRIFAQFILVPLVAVYQVLLSAYLLKVVVTGKWPSGLIGWLVSAEAIAGMLAILLVHPVRERAENLWVRTFARGFYIALIPSIVMLGLSIGKRVAQYGVTEDRYFVIALTVWLGAVSIYFMVRRDGDIRLIPITLAALACFTFGGPWGAYRTSLASQRARLVRLLEQNGMWNAGKPAPATSELSYRARRDLSSQLTYLLGTHGAAMRPLLGAALAGADSIFDDPDRVSGSERAGRVATRLGFTYVNSWEAASDSGGAFSWNLPWTDTVQATAVDGLSYHVEIDNVFAKFKAGPRSLVIWCDDRGHRLVLGDDHGRGGPLPPVDPVDTLAFASLDSLVAASRAPRAPGAMPPRVELAGPGARGMFQVKYLTGQERPEFHMMGLTGHLYFSLTDTAAITQP